MVSVSLQTAWDFGAAHNSGCLNLGSSVWTLMGLMGLWLKRRWDLVVFLFDYPKPSPSSTPLNYYCEEFSGNPAKHQN